MQFFGGRGQAIDDTRLMTRRTLTRQRPVCRPKQHLSPSAGSADQGKDPRHYASIAKISGAQMVFRVADRMLQVHGGMGYAREVPIERILREVRVYRIFEGTDEIQKRTIARDLLRDYVRVGD